MNAMTEYEQRLMRVLETGWVNYINSPERRISYLEGCVFSAIWLTSFDDPSRDQLIDDIDFLLMMTYYIE